jgi:hypothetical protein
MYEERYEPGHSCTFSDLGLKVEHEGDPSEIREGLLEVGVSLVENEIGELCVG